MKREQRGFLHGGGISDEEMYDANEREMGKEPQNFRHLEKLQTVKQKPENKESSAGAEKRVNIFGVICMGLSILCLVAAIGAMVYFVGV